MLPFLVPVLFTFYIQGVLKLKKNSGAKGLKNKKGGYSKNKKYAEIINRITAVTKLRKTKSLGHVAEN
jgi:hypothetical protein